ncbi:hypothetical protein GQ53DRAFT_741360 [Thozetella sp. PMI_491]|nr:hypothetical protein GQ53DRAFT_741360 [Thozetella sp. PMI_491]
MKRNHSSVTGARRGGSTKVLASGWCAHLIFGPAGIGYISALRKLPATPAIDRSFVGTCQPCTLDP